MKCKLRFLNSTGVQQFREYIEKAYNQEQLNPPTSLLEDDNCTEAIIENIYVENIIFNNKRDMAKYLMDILSQLPPGKKEFNSGLWTWLALFYFDQICPLIDNRRKVNKYWHYILDVTSGRPNWKTYFRHMIASPYYVYCCHRDSACLILEEPVSKHGEYMEQLASRQEIITNKGIIKAADVLYFDSKSKKSKKGATGTRPGNLRRLAQDIFWQLHLTYDLYSMSEDEIISLLPRGEFERWLKSGD